MHLRCISKYFVYGILHTIQGKVEFSYISNIHTGSPEFTPVEKATPEFTPVEKATPENTPVENYHTGVHSGENFKVDRITEGGGYYDV